MYTRLLIYKYIKIKTEKERERTARNDIVLLPKNIDTSCSPRSLPNYSNTKVNGDDILRLAPDSSRRSEILEMILDTFSGTERTLDVGSTINVSPDPSM